MFCPRKASFGSVDFLFLDNCQGHCCYSNGCGTEIPSHRRRCMLTTPTNQHTRLWKDFQKDYFSISYSRVMILMLEIIIFNAFNLFEKQQVVIHWFAWVFSVDVVAFLTAGLESVLSGWDCSDWVCLCAVLTWLSSLTACSRTLLLPCWHSEKLK